MPSTSLTARKTNLLCIATGVLMAGNAMAQDQVISHGNRMLIERGLQVQASIAHTNVTELHLGNWEASYFNAINFAWAVDNSPSILQSLPGVQWGRWGGMGLLQANELPYLPQLVQLQYGDEQDLTDPGRVQETANGFAAWRAAYPNAIMVADQNGYLVSADTLRNYMQVAQPDMLLFNFYPFRGEAYGRSIYMNLWYEVLEKHRVLAAAGNDGTGQSPIPHGVYTQTWSPDGHSPSESEIRLNHFSAWTFGAKLTNAWLYADVEITDGETTTLFNSANTPTSAFHQIAETNRQGLNLGPALVRLNSTDVYYVPGRHTNSNQFDTNGNSNSVPDGLMRGSSANGWGHSFITGLTVQNIGTTNIQSYIGGSAALAGDVVLGFFEVLGDPSAGANDETYFMVLNALTAPNASADQTQQRITLQFDFADSGITALQRLNRLTGLVETIPLTHLSGSLYSYQFILDGGTADLFKFDTGATFVPEPGSLTGLLLLTTLAGRRMGRQ